MLKKETSRKPSISDAPLRAGPHEIAVKFALLPEAEAEVEPEADVAVLEQNLVAAYLVHATVEGEGCHFSFPFIGLGYQKFF